MKIISMTTYEQIRLCLLLVAATAVACSEQPKVDTEDAAMLQDTTITSNDSFNINPPDQPFTTTDSAWIDDFRAFRDAVYRKDKEALVTYFDFPVTDAGELWYYLQMENDPVIPDAEKKPFTEQDFYKYFDRLFPQSFIATLLKIKSKELESQGSSESPPIVNGKTTYRMLAERVAEDESLRLSLGFLTEVEEGEVGESAATYVFRIVKGKKLKFVGVGLAG